MSSPADDNNNIANSNTVLPKTDDEAIAEFAQTHESLSGPVPTAIAEAIKSISAPVVVSDTDAKAETLPPIVSTNNNNNNNNNNGSAAEVKPITKEHFPAIRAIRITADGSHMVDPISVDCDRQRRLAQLVLAFEMGEKLSALRMNITHSTLYGNKQGKRLTLIIDPLIAAHARDFPDNFYRDLVSESNGDLKDIDFRLPIVEWAGIGGLKASLHALQNNFSTMLYGETSNTDPPMGLKEVACQPCHVLIVPEIVSMKVPIHSNAKSRVIAGLSKKLEEATTEINSLSFSLGEWSKEKTNEASDRVQQGLELMETLQEMRRTTQEVISKTIHDLFVDASTKRRSSLFDLDKYSLSAGRETATWGLDEDTMFSLEAGDTFNPFFGLTAWSQMFNSEMVNIRILYHADSDLSDMFHVLEDRKEDAERFDVTVFSDRIAEGRRASFQLLKKAIEAKKETLTIKRHLVAIHFWVPAPMLSEFFSGIDEMRAKHTQDRITMLERPQQPSRGKKEAAVPETAEEAVMEKKNE